MLPLTLLQSAYCTNVHSIIRTHTLTTMCHSTATCHSPATPEKAGKHATKSSPNVAMPFAEKLTSTSKVKHASINEPSPASTYGDTVASSCPATPQEVGNHGKYFHSVYRLPCFLLLLHVFKSAFSVQPDLRWENSLSASASCHFPLEECTHFLRATPFAAGAFREGSMSGLKRLYMPFSR